MYNINYPSVSYLTQYTAFYSLGIESTMKIISDLVSVSKVTSLPLFLMTDTPVFYSFYSAIMGWCIYVEYFTHIIRL